jgi:hypothetical protein
VQEGLVSLVIATSTLSEGINLPLETIIVPSVRRGAGRMSAREFANLAGRAGRPGIATEGRTLVVLEQSTTSWDQRLRRYRELVAELSDTGLSQRTPAAPQASPLAELLVDLWEQWRLLTKSDNKTEFISWLEVTAPIPLDPLLSRDEDVPAAIEALDTLDSILLPAVVELELVRDATGIEEQMQLLWKQSFAARTTASVDLEASFVRRGASLASTVYPDKEQRRRLYRTGLPPRAGNQLLDLVPRLREAMATGSEYASWPLDQQLEYVAGIVGIIGEIDRFRYAATINRRRVDWRDVLGWWFDPVNRPNDPGPQRRADWYSYVSQQFVYRFSWGLGSFVGVVTGALHGDAFTSTRLEDWPLTGLPWAVFWLKELITWGTLDPVVSFLLARGQAATRTTAHDIAQQYYEFLPDGPSDLLDPSRIRAWADSIGSDVQESRSQRPQQSIAANLLEDFTDQSATRWRVLPVSNNGALLWVDPAGYRLATTRRPDAWQTEFLDRFDFFLDTSRSVVVSEPYL